MNAATDAASNQPLDLRDPDLCRALVDHSPDCIKLLSRDGVLMQMNAGGLCAMQIPDAALVLGKDWATLWPEAMQETARVAVDTALRNGASRFEGPCPTFGGEPRWWDVQLTRIGLATAEPQLLCVSRDVTDLRASIIRAATDEARYQAIAENTSDIIVRAAPDGTMLYVSPACRRYGYEPEELIGRHGAEHIHPEDLERLMRNTAEMLAGRIVPDADRMHRFRKKDGDWVWLEGNPRVLRDENGQPREVVNVFRDVSDRKAKTDLFESAFEHAIIGKALVGLDGRFIKVNPALCTLLGYDEAAMLQLNFRQIGHPDDMGADLVQLEKLRAGEIDSFIMDKRYMRADGSLVWGQRSVSLVREPNGAPKYYVAQVMDLSARRAAEGRYRMLAEHASDLVSVHDMKGICLYMSPSSERMLGYLPDEIVGRSPTDFMPAEDHAGLMAAQDRLRDAGVGDAVRHTMRMRRRDGGLVWIEYVARIADQEGRRMIVASSRDVTERVHAQQALERQSRALDAARMEAEAAAAAKTEFLANMSHEIRTPLTAVVGFTGLLSAREDLSEEARRFVDRAQNGSRALLALVNDILDYSKIEAGHFEVCPQTINLEAQAADALTLFEAQAAAKGLTLTLEAASALPEAVDLDPDRFRQILLNLISNAVKFTEQGGVTVSLRHAGSTLTCEVRDTGAGMTIEQQDKLFQRFSQVDTTTTRRHGGTGLGLAICKGLSEAMGGGVTVRSAVDHGTTFIFTVQAPLAKRTLSVEAPEEEALGLSGVQVLVIDDNATNRELARTFLQLLGASVTEADGGLSGLEAARSHAYDAILLDIRMPGMDGPEALLRLRNEPGPNQAVPVLAFSADADLTPYLAAGFDGFVRKPIQASDLLQEVWEATVGRAPQPVELRA